MQPDKMTDREVVAEIYEDLVRKAVAAEHERCTAWAKLYWDGDVTDEYEMYVGIRDGLPPPNHLKGTGL